jgi:uncharacterized protein (DUF1684 family)
MRCLVTCYLIFFASVAFAATPKVESPQYRQDYMKWRQAVENSRRHNWLTLVGLFWLHEGENSVGSDMKNDVPLPADKAAPQVGTIAFHDGKATFTALPSAKVTSDGKPVHTIALQPDTTDKPTVLQIGDLRMHMIQRGNRFGMRVKDTNNAAARAFKGTEFYPLSDSYVVDAKFIPYDKPKQVAVPTVIGSDATMDSPGELEFTLNGQKMRIQAYTEGSPELSLIIKDKTSGKATYPAGRFIDTDAPKDGHVVIDFNRAYDPPCAFTAYATCPLPPRQNVLPVAVEAGEKYLGHHN